MYMGKGVQRFRSYRAVYIGALCAPLLVPLGLSLLLLLTYIYPPF
jgi:hypothetical protein